MSATGGTPARERVVRVGVGEGLPRVTAPLVGGGEITLPDAVGDEWAVVLFYRGHWCPYCRQQLTDFQRNLAKLTEADVAVVALSVDDKGDAETTVDRHALQFPVAYGLDPVEIRDTFGSYLGGDDSFVQATGFVLRPGGLVELAVYSSGAVGRLVAADVLGLIQYARKQE